MSDIEYRGYLIYFDPPSIPIRTMDWHYRHEDYDPTPLHSYGPPGDNRCGSAASLEAAKAEVDEMIADEAEGEA